MFSDESHFFVQGQRSQHVRRSLGEKLREGHIDQNIKHPEKKMFWGSFSFHGVGSLRPVEGMMRSAQYIDVIETKAIPEMQKAFPDGSGVFQQDLAPCHTSKIVTNSSQNQHDKSVGLAWKLPGLKSNRKFVVYH